MNISWIQADASLSSKIPLPWAVSLMLLAVLPLTFFLDNWNFPLWVSFIVWAEYFVLGGKLATWKIILPSLLFGALMGTLWCASAVLLAQVIETFVGPQFSLYLGYAVTNLFWVTLLVYACQWVEVFSTGVLAVFNGFSLQLAVFFTGSIPAVGGVEGVYSLITWSFFWTVALAYFGWFLGWFNVVLTFPRYTNTE